MGTVDLSVVIPARDEESGLPVVLDDLRKTVLPAGTEILVVDDGSRDRTGSIAAAMGARVLRLEGRGYGGALKAGFEAANGQWLTFLDADATYPAETVARLWDCRHTATMILADRFAGLSRMPLVRRVGNRVFNLLASLRAGRSVPDLCSGQRLFPRELLPAFRDLPDGLDFSPAMTLRCLAEGIRLRWIPTEYHQRAGTSKLSEVRDGLRFLGITLRHPARPTAARTPAADALH